MKDRRPLASRDDLGYLRVPPARAVVTGDRRMAALSPAERLRGFPFMLFWVTGEPRWISSRSPSATVLWRSTISILTQPRQARRQGGQGPEFQNLKAMLARKIAVIVV